nr:VP3 [Yonaguni orbivirus]
MAEYGILLWHDDKSSRRSGQKVDYPSEYDLIVNLDSRVELDGSDSESVMQIQSGKTILRAQGIVEIAGFNETVTTHISSETMKKETSDIIQRGFIDRCIGRLTDEDRKENLKKAVQRARNEQYWMGLSYYKAGSGMFGVQLTHSELITKKHIIQTLFVERRSVCLKRLHLDGLERLMSQSLNYGFLQCYLGKVRKTAKQYGSLMEAQDSEKSNMFLLEIFTRKLELENVAPSREVADEDLFSELSTAQTQNKIKGGQNLVEGSASQTFKLPHEDLIEEIKDIMESGTVTKPLTLYGRESKYYTSMRIVVWKSQNDALVKATVKDTSKRSDLKRIPMKTRGIMSVFAASMKDLFDEIGKVGTLKTCGQIQKKQDDFWKQWHDDIMYQDDGRKQKIIERIYQGSEVGCKMEQVILYNLYEFASFIYMVIARNSPNKVKRRLLADILKNVKLSPTKTEKVKEANEVKLNAAVDSYINTYLLFDRWDDKLLLAIIDSRSYMVAITYILRYANGDDFIEIDSDELESDLNLVLIGQMGLEAFLRSYVPMLTELYQRAINLNSMSTIEEILDIMIRHNYLIIYLSMFMEVKIKGMLLKGVPYLKRFRKDKYYLAYFVPDTHNRSMKGVHFIDTIHLMFDVYGTEEFRHELYDRFEGVDDEKWTEEWTEYVKTETERIDLEKEKYGEKSVEWAKQQKIKLARIKKDAQYRHELLLILREIFFSKNSVYSRRERTIDIEYISEISHLRLNYQRMSMFMGTHCRGFTDIATLCMPISAPHKSMIVICLYSDAVNDTVVDLCIKNRFKRVYKNIYQIVYLKVKPQEVRYDENRPAQCSEMFNIKGEGEMTLRVLPYLSQGLDCRAVIIKSAKGERGSKFFFVKLSGAE